MANTSINVRMDADLKRQFEAFCADIGMTMTTAINVFAKKSSSREQNSFRNQWRHPKF